MNRISCEICGSSDLVKHVGVFVCQACGCKYSADEIKRQLVEITNPVQVVGVETADTLFNTAIDWLNLQNEDRAVTVLRDMVNRFPGDKRGWQKLARLRPEKHTIDNALRLGDSSLLPDLADIEKGKREKEETAKRANEEIARRACNEIRNGHGENWVIDGRFVLESDIRYKECQCVKDLLKEGLENAKYMNELVSNIAMPRKTNGEIKQLHSNHVAWDKIQKEQNEYRRAIPLVLGINGALYMFNDAYMILGNLIFITGDEGVRILNVGKIITKSFLQQVITNAGNAIKNNLCFRCGTQKVKIPLGTKRYCPVCEKR